VVPERESNPHGSRSCSTVRSLGPRRHGTGISRPARAQHVAAWAGQKRRRPTRLLPHPPQDRLVGRLAGLLCAPGQLPVQASVGLLDEQHDLTRRLRDAFANDEPTADLRQHFETAPAYRPPVAKRYLVNDATVEKLGELLNHNPNGLLLFRDEVSGFLHTMDRPGHENDRAFYCEAWNGTGAYTYDRIGRGTLHIRAACISVLGGNQPGPLERYLRNVFGGRGDDGLIQRFQLAVWPDVAGRWQNVDRWPDAAARGRAIEVFHRLNRLEAATVGAEELTPEEVPFLRFDPRGAGPRLGRQAGV
jgi:hypothetical protein